MTWDQFLAGCGRHYRGRLCLRHYITYLSVGQTLRTRLEFGQLDLVLVQRRTMNKAALTSRDGAVILKQPHDEVGSVWRPNMPQKGKLPFFTNGHFVKAGGFEVASKLQFCLRM